MDSVFRLDRCSFVRVRGVELAEIVLDAAGRRDQQQPGGSVGGLEAMRAPARHEDETAGQRRKAIIATNHRQLSFEHLERLVLVIVDVQRRSAPYVDFRRR
jgi:hypothetical protein